ncbi:hypothetical protein [Helicobacter pylori]|nr:hypothetical protein [Helicobacter pylori]EMH41048.1 hypothetical protein HMPREF1429_01185 [Helicobacter pylori GAM93Bi]
MACESSKISFASLTCENFHACVCLHVYFSFLLFSSLWLLCFKLVCDRI